MISFEHEEGDAVLVLGPDGHCRSYTPVVASGMPIQTNVVLMLVILDRLLTDAEFSEGLMDYARERGKRLIAAETGAEIEVELLSKVKRSRMH